MDEINGQFFRREVLSFLSFALWDSGSWDNSLEASQDSSGDDASSSILWLCNVSGILNEIMVTKSAKQDIAKHGNK